MENGRGSRMLPHLRRAGGAALLLVMLLGVAACQSTQNGQNGATPEDDAAREAPTNAASDDDAEASATTDAHGESDTMETQPRPGFVTDMEAFEEFIATRPDAADFRAVYPDVHLVMPDDITTREFRSNNSRYFARFDDHGRIVGGSFQ